MAFLMVNNHIKHFFTLRDHENTHVIKSIEDLELVNLLIVQINSDSLVFNLASQSIGGGAGRRGGGVVVLSPKRNFEETQPPTFRCRKYR